MKIDYIGILKEAWAVVRSNRGLWGLGIVQMVFGMAYGLMLLAAIMPIVMGTALYQQADFGPEATSELLGFADFFTQNFALFIAVVVLLFVLVIVTGVFQVAAFGGSVTQVDRVRQGGKASFTEGMREGMRHWWRTAGLLAISAIPSLVYLFALSLVGFFTLSMPIIRGDAPDMAGLMLGQTIVSPLALLSSLVAIPLSLLVQLSLRYALLVGQEWKPALKSGWQLMKARLGAVALMYLSMYIVALIASVAMQLVFVVVSIASIPLMIFAATAQSAAGLIAAAAVMIVAMMGIVFVYGALYAPFISAVFTIFWRQLTPGYLSDVAPSSSQPVAATVQPATSWTE